MPTAIDDVLKDINKRTNILISEIKNNANEVGKLTARLVNFKIKTNIQKKRSPEIVWNFSNNTTHIDSFAGRPFKPLSEKWLARKRINKDKILIHKDYELYRGVNLVVQGNNVFFKMKNTKKAFSHQYGSTSFINGKPVRIPPRPYIGINKAEAEKISNRLIKIVNNAIRRAFSG